MTDVNREPTPGVYARLIGGCLHLPGTIITFARCEPCMYGSCVEPPAWHSWAGAEDLDHVDAARQVKIAGQICACECAREMEQCS